MKRGSQSGQDVETLEDTELQRHGEQSSRKAKRSQTARGSQMILYFAS